MKAYPWLLFASFELIALISWPAAELTQSVYRHDFEGLDFPAVTLWVLTLKHWLPMFPLPWGLYALTLSRRATLGPPDLFTFTGTIFLAGTLFTCWVLSGLLMPYYTTHIYVGVPKMIIGK